MLRLLLMSLCWSVVARAPQEASHSPARKGDATRPYIHYCRSPNMETFTCWWHPIVLDNGSQSDANVTYSLKYTLGNKPPKECPDYISGGPYSCFFDASYTQVWEVYCMNVTAHSQRGVFTSEQYCLDVADIVEIDPPFNLTYTLMNTSEEQSGRTVLVSWQYPIDQHVQMGWITLIYELHFRLLSEPNNWKVKDRLREPHLELLDLPVGSYEVQVRCRSKNNHLWSKWSSSITMVIPARHIPDRMLYTLVLVTGVGIMTLLIIGFGVIPRGKRIKAFFLPPIPKPRIRGIDPMLLKKGKMDEINRHFSSLHGYKPPHYCEETWYLVSMDEGLSLAQLTLPSKPKKEQQDSSTSTSQSPVYPQVKQRTLQTTANPVPYCQEPVHYREGSAYITEDTLEVALPPESQTWAWPTSSNVQPELVSFPGMDYSMILNPTLVTIAAPLNSQDFYTCVNGITPSGAVHLVPCVSNPVKGSPYFQLEKDSEKSSQLVVYLEKQAEAPLSGNGVTEAEAEQSEFTVPLLPRLTDRS